MPETVIVALIVGVLSLPGMVLAYLTFMQTRKTLPQQAAAIEATTAQDKAETSALDTASYEKLYGMYKEMSFDMVKVLEELRKLKVIQGEQAAEIERLKGENAQLLARAVNAENAFTGLEQRTKDYPERLVLAEAEIRRLQGVASNNAAARVVEAENTKEAISAALHTPAPSIPTTAPAGGMAVTIPADTPVIIQDDTAVVVSPPPGQPGSD